MNYAHTHNVLAADQLERHLRATRSQDYYDQTEQHPVENRQKIFNATIKLQVVFSL